MCEQSSPVMTATTPSSARAFDTSSWKNLAVAYRTSQNASDQGIGMIEVGGIAGAPGDFINAINQRNAAAGGLPI